MGKRVEEILGWYGSESPGVLKNLRWMLESGTLAGTGKLVILPVDQGFEHGPARSFAPNPPAYDPHYHYQLAIDAGLSAYAAPLGMLEAGASSFAGQIPTILKMNSANSLSTNKDQAVTSSVRDALRLGCSAIGFTIYPGSEDQYSMMEEVRELAEEARASGLAVVVWSYPRGSGISKEGETGLDVSAYAAQIAAQMGAHIIKVKPPDAHIEQEDARKVYEKAGVPMLPVVVEDHVATWTILAHVVALVVLSLVPVIYGMGWIYLLGAASGGIYFLRETIRLHNKPTIPQSWQTFAASIVQLGLLLVGAIVDRILLG